MTGWVVRGIGMGLINVGVRILLGVAVTQWPLHGSQLRWLGLATVLIAVIVWAGLDGVRDRRANPDPDHGADLTMVWLKAAALGGLGAGLVAWIVQMVVDFSLGQNTLFFELTSGAAFTILLIFIPATIAAFVGRMLVGKEAKRKLDSADAERDKQRHDRHDREAVSAGSVPAEAETTHDASYEQASPEQASPQQTQWSGDNADTEVFQAVDPDAGDPRETAKKHRDQT